MIRRLMWCVLLSLALTGSAFAGFVNGGFETGDFTGWTQGAGYWYGGMSNLAPANYLPGGQFYDMSANASAVVGPGLDPNTDNNLNMVYAGNYAARVNDSYNNYSVSVISQTVSNYTDPVYLFRVGGGAAIFARSHRLGQLRPKLDRRYYRRDAVFGLLQFGEHAAGLVHAVFERLVLHGVAGTATGCVGDGRRHVHFDLVGVGLPLRRSCGIRLPGWVWRGPAAARRRTRASHHGPDRAGVERAGGHPL